MSVPSESKVEVKVEVRGSQGRLAAHATTFSLMGGRTPFHGPDLTLMLGSQLHSDPAWKVTKAGTIGFLTLGLIGR